MILLSDLNFSLPLSNPVLIFSIILFIILFAPLLLNKLKIPQLIGLIIAGAIIGPYGFNLLERDSSVVLFGTVGLLYIMFLAGLEIDLADFKKNSSKSIVFGLFTFLIPMSLGILAGLYVLNFNIMTSVLLASMFASHTLIAYPIISKMGITKNKAVNITVGGTMITDTLALLVLAVIAGMATGELNNEFWIRLIISVIVFALIVTLGFPLVGRWFFKKNEDNISQYIFVLGLVFMGAFLAEAAGIEAIIGAFLAGLALNRLIPHTSPLMNRIEFVGNALFIPFFLIGVGMLIDYSVFFNDTETIIVAVTMTVVATLSKYLAATLTQKTFKFSTAQRDIIFGLSNAQAAATLAAVLVGYEIKIGVAPDGTEIRLLNEAILNGTILMILVTCTIASFVAQRGATKIAIQENQGKKDEEEEDEEAKEKILIPINYPENIEELINLGVTVKSQSAKNNLLALNIIPTDSTDESLEKNAKKLLEKASVLAAATDNILTELIRYDSNIVNGITNVVKENKVSDIILGLHKQGGISDSFLGNLTEGILSKCNATTLIYRNAQPINTIQRHIIVVPINAEKEMGFPFWLLRVWNIGRNTGAKLVFYASAATLEFIRQVNKNHPIEAEFVEFSEWEDFLIISRDMKANDALLIIMSRKTGISYNQVMGKMPKYLNNYFNKNNYILVFPMQFGFDQKNMSDYSGTTLFNPLLNNMEKFDDLGKTLSKLFKKK
ncbi:cation:proton antiporter [Litoribacter ruber]|uniref:Cation:proton antiporter n=1 Tax=Litoribacter ruber TaxID=702568 RepID=A0AAP2CER5_9BACT|nr:MULTISPECIES: cation:proton antiporter [Litoribacter]MBS9523156.1 cation:proton antiporter [Litoribacter alkaliphilus]MBT0810681.1 cation:proton antiporter [Litoribacter ruber]